MDIYKAIEKGNYKGLKKALEKDKTIDINSIEMLLEPVLFYVLEQGMIDIAHLFIDYGYDVKKLNSYDKSLPMTTDDIELIKKMLNLGADINAKDNIFNATLLSNVLSDCDIEFAQYLIEKGAKLEDVQWNVISSQHKERMENFKLSLEEKKQLENQLDNNINKNQKSIDKPIKLKL